MMGSIPCLNYNPMLLWHFPTGRQIYYTGGSNIPTDQAPFKSIRYVSGTNPNHCLGKTSPCLLAAQAPFKAIRQVPAKKRKGIIILCNLSSKLPQETSICHGTPVNGLAAAAPLIHQHARPSSACRPPHPRGWP